MGAAWRLTELAALQRIPADLTWRLVESEPGPGGLARSTKDVAGFTWDFGGHVIYSHYAYFDRLYRSVLGDELVDNPRHTWVYLQNRFVPFPIQHNVHLFGRDIAERVLNEVAAGSRAVAAPRSFREWLVQRYGATLCDLFFLPYNFKMWGVPADRMGVEWTARKSGSRLTNVPGLDPEMLRQQIDRSEAVPGWTGATPFPYPRNGGSGAFWARLAAALPAGALSFRDGVVGIDLGRRLARLAGGATIRWRRLINTMPLVELPAMLDGDERRQVSAAVAGLEHSSVHFVGIGLRGETPAAFRDRYWIYCTPESMPFFRATVLSNYAPSNVPAASPHWSMLFEVTSSPHRPVDATRVVDDCIAAAAGAGWIDVERIVSRWSAFSRFGYPVPTIGRDTALARVGSYLETRGVMSRGRFGGWKYEASNQDNTFMQGLEAVDRLVYGAEEITYSHPELLDGRIVGRIVPDLARD